MLLQYDCSLTSIWNHCWYCSYSYWSHILVEIWYYKGFHKIITDKKIPISGYFGLMIFTGIFTVYLVLDDFLYYSTIDVILMVICIYFRKQCRNHMLLCSWCCRFHNLSRFWNVYINSIKDSLWYYNEIMLYKLITTTKV